MYTGVVSTVGGGELTAADDDVTAAAATVGVGDICWEFPRLFTDGDCDDVTGAAVNTCCTSVSLFELLASFNRFVCIASGDFSVRL